MKAKQSSQALPGGGLRARPTSILYRLWMQGCWRVRKRFTIYAINQHIKELDFLAEWEKALPLLRGREVDLISEGEEALGHCQEAIEYWAGGPPTSPSHHLHPGDAAVGVTAGLLLLLLGLGVI